MEAWACTKEVRLPQSLPGVGFILAAILLEVGISDALAARRTVYGSPFALASTLSELRGSPLPTSSVTAARGSSIATDSFEAERHTPVARGLQGREHRAILRANDPDRGAEAG
jgi:hypothetical protein